MLWLVAVYAVIGLGFGIAFVVAGVDRVDAAARGAGWGFRIMILPGAVALWPLLLLRWRRAA